MYLLNILNILIVISVVTAGGIRHEFRYDYTYYQNIDGWLKLHKIPSDFHEARLRCQLEGSVLASPLSSQLQTAMISFMKDHSTDKVYTGINAAFSRGDFHSIEGVPLSNIPHTWASAEPDNAQDKELCITMSQESTLSQVNCATVYPYMCYKKRESGILRNNCGTIDNAYTLDARTGHCYKFHAEPRTWSRAFMACSAEGGYLAVINSKTEATVIRELFAKFPESAMPGNFLKEVAFVGFHDYDEHGTWLTVHGQTLEQAGYADFDNMDNLTMGQFCGSVFRSARYNDLWCENKHAFICEKHPDSLDCSEDYTISLINL